MPSSPGALIVRADAGPQIGAGHVMRCLALAQAWRRIGGEAIFVSRQIPARLEQRLAGEGVRVEQLTSQDEDASQTVQVAKAIEATAVVIDNYALGDDYRTALRSASLRVLALNDFSPIAVADIVLNSNPTAGVDDYRDLGEDALLLLGPRYCLLRDEFVSSSPRPKAPNVEGRRVLIAGGGADPTGLTSLAIEALSKVKASIAEAIVLVGGANPNRAAIERQALQAPFPVRVVFDVLNVYAELQQADFAITAAGSACWEMAYAGLPMLTVVTAANQEPVASAIAASGAGIDLGWRDQLDSQPLAIAIEELATATTAHRQKMSQAGRRLVDGRGAERVARLLAAPAFRFRRATMDDACLLWTWRNDPAVRQVSLSTDEIPYESHCNWLADRLQRRDCQIFIVTDQAGEPIGQVRFDKLGAESRAEISVSLAAASRGKGYGPAMIRKATEYVLGRRLAVAVEAIIKPDNAASQRAFERAGYLRISPNENDNGVLRYATDSPPQQESSPIIRAVA